METISEYIWIPIILFLVWICYKLWKAGKYRDPGQENTYFAGTKRRNVYQCPYDIEGRSCTHMNTAAGYLDINCSDCDWYNNGVRPSKF